MGIRVAEIREVGCEEAKGWIAFQSTSGSCFSPIFREQLSAELFAAALRDIYPNWSDSAQEKLQGRIVSFMRTKFGDEPEDCSDYIHYLEDPEADLLAEFRRWV